MAKENRTDPSGETFYSNCFFETSVIPLSEFIVEMSNCTVNMKKSKRSISNPKT